MSEKNVLILQSNIVLRDSDMQKLRDDILRDMELGVVILPSYIKILKMPEEEIGEKLVVTNCGEYKHKHKQWVIRDVAGCYFVSLGKSPGTATIWESNKNAALKYDSKVAAENMKRYLWAFHDCHNLKVEELDEQPEPKLYVIKSKSGMYLRARWRDLCILEFTQIKSYAQKFYKESAERIIEKNLDSSYTLEEA